MKLLSRCLVSWISRKDYSLTPDGWKGAHMHFGQFGEDIYLDKFFRDKENGFFVDVGAFEPFKNSNTYLLYKRGWTGINVEPNPEVKGLFKKHRPRDINLCCGVGEKEESLSFHRFQLPVYNTFSEEWAEECKKNSKYLGSMKIPVRPLSTILEEYMPEGKKLDLLTVDCEGLDLKVLKSNNWVKYRPTVVAVEDHDGSEDTEIGLFLKNLGYRKIAQCVITAMFVDQNFNN